MKLVLFTNEADLAKAALSVDIRNVITHNRGIINRLFIQLNGQFAEDLGKRVVLDEQERRNAQYVGVPRTAARPPSDQAV